MSSHEDTFDIFRDVFQWDIISFPDDSMSIIMMLNEKALV